MLHWNDNDWLPKFTLHKMGTIRGTRGGESIDVFSLRQRVDSALFYTIEVVVVDEDQVVRASALIPSIPAQAARAGTEEGAIMGSDWPGPAPPSSTSPVASPVWSSQRSFLLSFLPFGPKQRTLPPSNLLSTQLQVNCNCFPSYSRHIETPINMFRNALRQSTRAVGAISATSRVAAVSPPCQRHHRPQSPSQSIESPSIPSKPASSR